MKLFRKAKWYFVLESAKAYYVFGIDRRRNGLRYSGYSPHKQKTYRLRFGPFEFERTTK